MSVTSSTSASAFSPRALIAAAASSISALVRAASDDAAASPMPRPPPVTSARLPSRRNEGVLARSIAGIGRPLSKHPQAGIDDHTGCRDEQRAEGQEHGSAALADVLVGPADAIGVQAAPKD